MTGSPHHGPFFIATGNLRLQTLNDLSSRLAFVCNAERGHIAEVDVVRWAAAFAPGGDSIIFDDDNDEEGLSVYDLRSMFKYPKLASNREVLTKGEMPPARTSLKGPQVDYSPSIL